MSTTRARFLAVLTVVALALGVLPASAAPGPTPKPGITEHISYTHDGSPGSGISNASSISADGRYVAFHSYARNLVQDQPSMSRPQVYVRDRLTGELEHISRAHDGGVPDSYAQVPEISADGRYVLFSSRSTNLDEGIEIETVRTFQYVHDRETGITELVTRTKDGEPADNATQNSSISGDGRYVAFGSRALNLAPGAVDTHLNCFVYDRETQETELVSRNADGEAANHFCWYPSLSHDGRYVAYHSQATNMVDGAGGALRSAVFVYDRNNGETEWASRTWNGGAPNNSSVRASISGDGRYVAFGSYATNMTPVQDSVLFPYDVYVRDRQARTTERVSVSSAGVQGDSSSYVPEISADGRFVLFTSGATNIDGMPNTHLREAVVRDRLLHRTERVSVTSDGQAGNGSNSYPGTVSADGRYVDFWTDATNFGAATDPELVDTYVRDRGPDLGVVGTTTQPAGEQVQVRGGAVFAGMPISVANVGQMWVQDSGIEVRQAGVYYHPHEGQLLFRSLLNGMQTVRGRPVPGMQYGWSFSTATGKYEIRISQRQGPVANVPPQVTRTAVELFRCEAQCTAIADLEGSVGTVGPVALAGLPLSLIGLSEGDQLTGMRAFIDLGDRALADTVTVQQLNLPSAEIPRRSVRLAVAPEQVPVQQVAFGPPVDLPDSRFDALLDRPGDNPHNVWARTCLGAQCNVEQLDPGE